MELKVGDVVKWAVPLDDADAESRFIVIELRGDRVLCEYVCDMAIKPQGVYQVDDLVRA